MKRVPKTDPRRLEAERLRYAADKERIKAIAKTYRENNRLLLREKARAYRVVNKESVRIAKAAQYRATKEKHNARTRANYEANKERAAELNRKWCRENRGRKAAIRQNREERSAGGRISANIAQRLLKLQRGMCACCCGASLKDGYHLDHILPLALGGKHEDTNIQLLAPRCNLRKRAKHPVEWAQQNGRLL